MKYVGNRIPTDGQSERLMLKYYDFLWQIRKYLRENYSIVILENLEKFPLNIDEINTQYYESVARAIESADLRPSAVCTSRYYIQKKTPFFIDGERYYEVTLQLTRAKKKLKIYWSSETMHEVIESFYKDERKGKSLEIIKAKLSVN